MAIEVSITRARPSQAGPRSHTRKALVTFPSDLGWMAMVGSGRTLQWLTFGHRSAEAAIAWLPPDLMRSSRSDTRNRPLVVRQSSIDGFVVTAFMQSRLKSDPINRVTTNDPTYQSKIDGALVRRLQAYASGARDDFLDVEADPGPQTAFGRQVLRCCRQIPYGATLTYGQLAAKAGHPGAARAVGRSMATNRIPLVIPCHRVISSNGGLCGYSAAGGLQMKQRLLELETGLLQNRGLGRAPRLARAGRDRRH